MDLIKSDREVHLVILGKIQDNSYRRALETSASKERIHLLGFQPEAAKMAAEFDIITLPSLRREGLPRAVIEGMAQGIAPVVTDAGGSAELIEPGVSGLVVPPGSPEALAAAFSELLSDDQRCVRMGLAAQQRIKECFNVEKTINETLLVYKELIPDTD